ncbi:MAG: HI1506-related protein [Pseudomonadota bacterium]
MVGVSQPGAAAPKQTAKPKAAPKAKATVAAAPAAAPATPPAPIPSAPPAPSRAAKRPGISVVGPRVGRRRAGFAFGAEPTRIALTDLDETQLAAIVADPTLTVANIEIEDGGQA